MLSRSLVSGLCLYLFLALAAELRADPPDAENLARYRAAALAGGDTARGKTVFESQTAACQKCHAFGAEQRRAGPDLQFIGDKLGREQLVQAVLEPSAAIHPDFGTVIVTTTDGKTHKGVLHQRTKTDLQFFDTDGKLIRLPLAEIEEQKRVPESLMPVGLQKTLQPEQFADLIAYLESLKQSDRDGAFPGLPAEIPAIEQPVRLVPLHADSQRFEFPVWAIAIPGHPSAILVVEQKSRKIWRHDLAAPDKPRELFADFSAEATTGEFEGVVCLAFHPRYRENGKYYVNYHVRNQGSLFSPVIVERQASADRLRDINLPSRRVLQIPQDTDIHWGGMLAFGPDGYLYIGTGDAGPQEDPEGHGQDLSLLTGKILRIDVDRTSEGRAYAIPESNPYAGTRENICPEIWASGFRMPWRFSWDPETGDFWIGDVGQNLFERVTIARVGENHGWNVFEGFMKFSDRYRQEGVKYTSPVLSYRRKYGVSVTGGYVYRGQKNPSLHGAYIFGDFESKRIFAMTQSDRQLIKVRQIGTCPQRIASFGLDAAGEVLLVGYEGTIYRLDLAGVEFDAEPQQQVRVKLQRHDAPAAARVSIVGGDGKPVAPKDAIVRRTKREEAYFYADGAFDVKLPRGPARVQVSGGLETIPQTVSIAASTAAETTVHLQPWIDMAARGWYSGDSHVHLHTGGPIDVSIADALIAARAEGVNFTNLCVSNNVGDDIRDPKLITGLPHPASTARHLLVFGEEMRSMIYGHMQFFGIRKLVEPQYTGFDDTPNHLDFPSNYTMAAEAVRQGGVVTYGHPLFAGQPVPFEDDLKKPSGAARELPIDAVLGVVQAVDLMSYNSDEELSTELWYRLLNCGLKLAACVGTDALLDRSTDPLGGDRMYVQTKKPFSMVSWLEGLLAGRTFVTNGPVPMLEVNGQGPGDTVALPAAGKVRATITVESYVPFQHVELIVNGQVAAKDVTDAGDQAGLRVRRLDVELPVERSSWVALRVRGPDHPLVFDGPAWAHTSPVYVTVGGQNITSRHDAEFFVDWIEQLLRVVVARNRYPTPEDRRAVETVFRKAQDEFRKLAKP